MDRWFGVHTLFAVVTVVVGFAALKLAQPVTLPLAFAVVLLLLFRPLQVRLERHLPRWAGPPVVMLAVFGAVAEPRHPHQRWSLGERVRRAA